MEDADVAARVAKMIKRDHFVTVPELAENLEVSEEQVAKVLSDWTPEGYAGEGKGGGWMSDDKSAEVRAKYATS